MNQELKNLLSLLIDSGKLVALIVQNKGIAESELAPLETLVLEAQPAISGSSAAVAQVKALTPEGEADLAAWLTTKLALANPKDAGILSAALQAAIANYALVKAIKG